MRLFLARHGQTDWNAVHRLQGQSDTALTALGHAQAQALADFLRSETIAAIYASPLSRAHQTAARVAAVHDLEVQLRPEMLEISYGVLEGRMADDPDPAMRALWAQRKRDPLRFQAPGAESYDDLQARVAPFADELRACHRNDTVVVVGHRASNRALMALLLGRSLEEAMRLKQQNDCVLEIQPGGDPELARHRYTPATPLGGNS